MTATPSPGEPGPPPTPPPAPPPPPTPGPSDVEFQARSKVWIEREGTVVISEYRARMLQAIAEHGSVAAAAEAIGLPYRTAWKKLREMELAAGVKLVDSGSGGAAGGVSRLTAAAVDLLEAFARVSEPLATEVRDRFEEERSHFHER